MSVITPNSPSQRWLTPIIVLMAVAAAAALGWAVIAIASPAIITVVVVGLVLAVLTVVRAEFGLALLVLINYTRVSDTLIKYQGFPSVAKPLVALLVVTVLIHWLLYKEPPRGWDKPLILIGFYTLVSYASLLFASDQATASIAFSDLLDDVIIAMLIVLLMQRYQSIRVVVWSLLVSGTFIASISVYQYITGQFTNAFGGFGQAAIMNIVGESNDYRILGTFGSPNSYAQVLVVLVPLAFDRLLNERRLLARFAAGFALVMVVLTVIFTFSRSGFLALAVVAFLTLLRYRPKLETLLIGLALAATLALFMPAQYTERLSTLTSFLPGSTSSAQSEVSFRGRINEYAVGFLMFADYPFLGVGLKNYPANYLEYSPRVGIDPRREQRAPHSLYIEVAAEQGILGVLAFALILIAVFRGTARAARQFGEMGLRRVQSMTSALSIGMIGYLTASFFVHGSYPRPFWLLVGILLAAANIAAQEYRIFQSQQSGRAPFDLSISIAQTYEQE